MVGDRELRVGEIEGSTAQGLYVVRLELPLRGGEKLFDSKGRSVGVVKDIIGNVKRPYAVVSVKTHGMSLKPGQWLFSKVRG